MRFIYLLYYKYVQCVNGEPTKANGSNRLLDHTNDLIFIRFQILCNKQYY